MWKYHDRKMMELKKVYNKINKQTQNHLQEIFNSFNIEFEHFYNIADAKTKGRIDTYIEEWKDKGLLSGYFGMLANNIYKRTRVKNSEILELLIYSVYIEEQSKLDEYEKQIMYEDANYYYQEGQQEVNKVVDNKKSVSILDKALFFLLLSKSNAKGYIWEDYVQAIVKYNSEQIFRQATIDLQQGKELDITNDIYQSIIKRQINSKLNINDNKISGDIDLTLIGINNEAKAEGIYSLDEKAKVKFIAVTDERSTKMCQSLNNKEFYIHDWNEFERYSKSNDTIKKYRCFGLVTGLNCPPINDGFHWCRSYITYLPKEDNLINKKYNIFSNKEEKKIESKYNINKARIKGIDKNVLINILDSMEKVYIDFPQIKGNIKEIQPIKHQNGGMNIEPDINDDKYVMQINKKFFANEEIAKKQYEQDIKTGFHPKGSSYKDMGTHELGHCVTYELIKRKYSNKDRIISDWNKNITAKEIVQKAFKNLGINDKLTQDILRSNISKYSITNYGETIGEAFADYYSNKSKSTTLSKEIIKIMKGMI